MGIGVDIRRHAKRCVEGEKERQKMCGRRRKVIR